MAIHGKYIVIEGNDGTGKSTQVELLRTRLKNDGIQTIEIHEPGGTAVADAIRQVIKNGSLERSAKTNLLLFTASRQEIWQHAEAHLAKGTWVIAARNYFSTLAYQGYGEGLDRELILSVTQQFTSDRYMTPDLAVILTLEDEDERKRRIGQRGDLDNPDTFESKDSSFQQRVSDGYLHIAKDRSLPVISALQTPQQISDEIYALIER